MNKLFIDTCSNKIILALINKNNYKLKIIQTNKNMIEIFITEINSFLKENQIKIDNIKHLYLINGPGNYSGLRTGCIFANILKLVKKIKIYYMSSCQFLTTEKKQIAIIDAKSSKYYFFYKNKIRIEKMPIITEIAEKNNLEIIDGYLNFDFWKSWKQNKKKFILTDLVKTNYIKKAI